MSGDRRPHWDSRQPEPRSPHRGRGGGRGQYRGRGRRSYHEDRDREDRDERERERRAAEAENYQWGHDWGQPSEYRDRHNDNGKTLSRDSSEHGSRRPLPPQKSSPSTPSRCGLGYEFASAIQSLTEWTTKKQLVQLKQERARQDCDEAKSIYEKGKPTHAQFPIEAERAKERYAKEKSALEVLEAKLKDADSRISTTKAVVAQHFDSVTSSKAGARSFRPGTEFEEGSLEAENRLLKENLSNLERDMKSEIRKLQTELDLRLRGAEDRMRSDSRDQVVALNSALTSKTDKLVSLSRDILDLKKNADYHKNQLVQQQDQLREHKDAIKKFGAAPFNVHSDDAPSLGNETSLLRIQSMETQLAAELSSNSKLVSRIEAVEQTQTNNMLTLQQEIQLASNSELPPRIEAVERAQATMLKIQENFEQVQRNVSEFDDDLGGLDQRIKALESSSHGPPRLSDATGPESSLTSVAPHGTSATSSTNQRIDALENYINASILEIRESQNASDIAHGSLIQGLHENVSKMETKVAELINDVESLETNQSVPSVEQLQKSVRDLRSAFAGLKSNEATNSTSEDGTRDGLRANIEALQGQQSTMSNEQRQLLRRIGSLESDFVGLNPVRALISTNGSENAASTSPTGSLQNGVPNPTFDWGPVLDSLKGQVAEIHSRLAETKQFEAGINMGIRNLDTRMNNIYTDHLCKQILGQLQTVYPNLARAEGQLADLKARMGVIDGILHDHTSSIGYMKEGQDAVHGRLQTWENQYATEIANLSAAIDDIRATIYILQSKDDSTKKPTASNELDTILKKELTERIDSLSEASKKQIEAACKRLEKQIEGIEHLIEFDEDGKVQSVKEVIHVLTENYGKMMGEFDALDYQVQELKKEAASSRGARASSSGSAAPVHRTKESGNKRGAPSSPSTSAQPPGQQQANKRRRNGLGPFLSDNED